MSNALTSKQNDCRSCYKCIRNCPTKSISFSNGQASIIPEECVMCGKCFLICPQECKVIRDDLPFVKKLLAENKEVIASVAPSYLASYPQTSFPLFREALLKLGFADAEETAIGATIVKNEYDRIIDEGKQDVLISTCCHSLNLLVEKHYPDAAKYLAPVLSPMLLHAQDIKRRHPQAKVVFLGPCISKKNEIEMYPGYDDAVLTFLELQRFFDEKKVVVAPETRSAYLAESKARLFPLEGGILRTMKRDNPDYSYLEVGGMDECIAAIKDILSGKIHHAFIEMSSCSGSCANGPAMLPSQRAFLANYLSIDRSAGDRDYSVHAYSPETITKKLPGFVKNEVEPSEEAIKAVLAKIGKTSKKDELNCSSCGYASCHDKAIAVLKGRATLEMCLPYLMEKARSFSNSIVESSTNAILVLNEELEIQLANPAAAELFGFASPKAMIASSASAFLDPDLFAIALGGTPIKGKKLHLENPDLTLDATINYDPQYHILIAVYRDVTKEVKQREKEQEIATKTASITSDVVEKNMRAVQEIALLLGESTAETKVALKELQDVIKKNGEDDE